ncbi:MAG TPA: amidohydrolase family protein [Candidatus Krumholzibacteria bacterium]|nr:amidohydrolase family protein [Candidatus Krumholzibacteria bacterium]
MKIRGVLLSGLLVVLAGTNSFAKSPAHPAPRTDTFCDSHFHLTNYIQEGITPQQFLKIMGNRVQRSTLFGIPLQQQWSYLNSGDDAPTYYLDTDAPLYYYSFTDAYIAMQYRSLSKADQARFDPMITGFNPTDMYAADHIKRVLKTFPGVFSGIGEFTIHKEFVSSKVAGGAATLNDKALDRILDFAAEVGLVVILHSDVDRPMAAQGSEPVFLDQMKDLLRRHPKTTIIWAHTGVGRVVRPIGNHIGMIESIVSDPAFNHVYFDISWDEVAKYVVATPETTKRVADSLNRYPDRFLFGSDTVAPSSPEKYYAVFDMYNPMWALLTPEASQKVRIGNYVRLFDEGRKRVRAWEKASVK